MEISFFRNLFFYMWVNLQFSFCCCGTLIILSGYGLVFIILDYLFWVEVFLSTCRFNSINYSSRVFYCIVVYFSLFCMFRNSIHTHVRSPQFGSYVYQPLSNHITSFFYSHSQLPDI